MYQKKHTHTLYEVIENHQRLGMVSDPSIVQTYIKTRKSQLAKQYPDIPMTLDTGQLQINRTDVFNGKADNPTVLIQLSRYFSSYIAGTALKINGTVVGYFKDKAEADQVLAQFKAAEAAKVKKSAQNAVHILSVQSNAKVISENVTNKTVEFSQKVLEDAVHLQPDHLSSPKDILEKLVTGGVPLHTYTVQPGDCLSCIASKLNIPESTLLKNNPNLTNHSILQIGQKINATQLQPMLSLETREQVVEVQNIPYTTEYQDDSSLGIGYTKVLKAGQNGKKQIQLDVTKVNGLVVASKTIQSTILQQPVSAKALKGTSPVAGPFSSKSDYSNKPKGNFLSWPFSRNYIITSPFGWRKDPFTGQSAFHAGIDIGAPKNTSIRAVADGVVLVAGRYGGYGNCVIINNGHSIHTLYGHMTSVAVKVGEQVKRGQVIGHVGMTGRATGPHLHFGVYWHGRAVDPWQLLINR